MREEGFPCQDVRTKGTAYVSPGKGKSQREGVKLRRKRSGEELRVERVKRKSRGSDRKQEYT